MFIRPVPFVGIAIVATLLIGAWWITRDDGQAADPEVVTETPATTPAAVVAPAVETGETLPDADSSTGDADALDIPATAVDGASGSSDSPFATAEPVDEEPGSPIGSSSSGDPATMPADDAPGGLADDMPARTGDPVVVPSSYPVSEAAKYYIPPEERGPGNLGGPPPLDFPGGPNDPDSGGGLAPPAGPGQ